MLIYLAHFLEQFGLSFSAFYYITLRAILAMAMGVIIVIALGKPFIRWLQKLQIKQTIRTDGPATHLKKQNTPTMGGLLILFSLLLVTILCADLSNFYIWISILTAVLFAAIGFVDDYLKVARADTKGLSAKLKIFWQSLAAFLVLGILYFNMEAESAELTLFIPIFKNWQFYLGPLYIVLGYFVLIGSSNAVNMTDGLDGLAIMPIIMLTATLGVFAYISGNVILAEYLHVTYLPDTGELTVLCAALIGVGLGFLWFNAHPAQLFMGDVGSLFLGAVMGVIAFSLRQEITLLIAGGIFVVEALSVILQVGYFKIYQRRILPMAPLHHSFEKIGIPETKVVVRFWIVGILLALISLATLKIR